MIVHMPSASASTRRDAVGERHLRYLGARVVVAAELDRLQEMVRQAGRRGQPRNE